MFNVSEGWPSIDEYLTVDVKQTTTENHLDWPIDCNTCLVSGHCRFGTLFI